MSSTQPEERRPAGPDGEVPRDRRLVRLALDGDAGALEELTRRLRMVPRALAQLNARRGAGLSAQDLEDLSQDTLVRLWEKLETFHGRATFENWAYRFALLEFMNRVRRRMRAPLRVDSPMSELSEPEDQPPAGARGPDPARLERLLDELGPPDADVIRLKHYEELTFNAIGERLGISPNTAKTQYYRGIVWLQNRLRVLEASHER